MTRHHPSRSRRLLRLIAAAGCMMLLALVVRAGEPEFPATDEQSAAGVTMQELGALFRRHCVRVHIHGKSASGKFPTVGEFNNDITNERPTLVGGYWWDDSHVVIEDPVIHDRYIRQIEVALPDSDVLYPARVAGRFVRLPAILLEVLPGPDGKMPKATPLRFEDGDIEEAIVLSYGWEAGEWRIKADAGIAASAVSDAGLETVEFSSHGVFIDEDGLALGLAFGDKAFLEEDIPYWYGRELPYSLFLGKEETDEAAQKLRSRLADSVLETRFRIRIRIDDEEGEEEDDWSLDLQDGQLRGGDAEVRAPGILVGRRHLLVPVSLPHAGIARIEDITVVTADERELSARFAGALRNYMVVLVEVEEDLPTESLPPGFTLLNPLAAKDVVAEKIPPRPYMEYFQRWHVDYSLGRRREQNDYDRWVGSFRGYRGDTVVLTRTNESDGSLAFDNAGNLVAVALTPRLMRSTDRSFLGRGPGDATPGFRPLDFLASVLALPEAIDPSLVPVEEERGQRLIDLGVEFQPLDRNSSRLFNAARETRGGHIGLLVTHVYPGSIADKIGLREHDVLLRLLVEGRKEPMELRSSGYAFGGAFDMGDFGSESYQSFMRYMPAPWPSRENVVSTLLTAVGAGRSVTLDYLREGEQRKADFVTGYFEADYRSARKERFTALGLTVKPITYEVARYFNRPEASGVIVSKVEVGGKSSVAGLGNFLLITHVDGRAIAGVDDFRAAVKPFEEGESASVELTVEGYGKTRLAKIE